jgi:predicted Zn-dependent protease
MMWLRSLNTFLGPQGRTMIVVLLGVTGLANLILNSYSAAWVAPLQSLMVLIFIIGTAAVFVWRMEPDARGFWVAMLAPSLVAVMIGLFVAPQYALAFFGGAFGWLMVGSLVFRARAPMQYQAAVKLLRKNQYAEAVTSMDELMKDEPKNPAHYHFRAQILRVWGKLDRAKRDYQTFIELAPENPVGHNSLSELLVQQRRYADALTAAQQANTLLADQWVTLYNLGMIEDRLGHSADVIAHLDRALALKVPDARHRLLIHLYRARAHARLGDAAAAQAASEALKRERGALQEWAQLLQSDQAQTLRAVLGEDVRTAQRLAEGALTSADVGRTTHETVERAP